MLCRFVVLLVLVLRVDTSSSPQNAASQCTDLTLQNGNLWHDLTNNNCSEYARDSRLCGSVPSAIGEAHALLACCVCGGGLPTPIHETCQDLPLPNGEPWTDGTGTRYGCTFYHDFQICDSTTSNFDLTASTACCLCGGGTLPSSPQPVGASPSLLDSCFDLTLPTGVWHDNLGPNYDCAFYAKNPSGECSDTHTNVYTPNQACCACGGGRFVASTVSPPTEAPPTPEPIVVVCTDKFRPDGGHWYKQSCFDIANNAQCDDDIDKACCSCGGGEQSVLTPRPFCRDRTLEGGAWHDSLDDSFGCAYYVHAGRCFDESVFAINVFSPKEACCECGGGLSGPDPETTAPTLTPDTAQPTTATPSESTAPLTAVAIPAREPLWVIIILSAAALLILCSLLFCYIIRLKRVGKEEQNKTPLRQGERREEEEEEGEEEDAPIQHDSFPEEEIGSEHEMHEMHETQGDYSEV